MPISELDEVGLRDLELRDACMRTAPKVMFPALFCLPVTSEVDISDMAEEVEPSHQYPVMLCCCVTDGSGGAV